MGKSLNSTASAADFRTAEGLSGYGEATVHYTPESGYSFGFAVEKVLEESDDVEGRRVGIALVVFTKLVYPVLRLASIDDGEEIWG